MKALLFFLQPTTQRYENLYGCHGQMMIVSGRNFRFLFYIEKILPQIRRDETKTRSFTKF